MQTPTTNAPHSVAADCARGTEVSLASLGTVRFSANPFNFQRARQCRPMAIHWFQSSF
jgi:hypothetical protein